jgi:hypothetical protein
MTNRDRIVRLIEKYEGRSEVSEDKAVIFTKSGKTSLTVNFSRPMTCFTSVNGSGEYRKKSSFFEVDWQVRWFIGAADRLDILREVVVPNGSEVVWSSGGMEVRNGRLSFTIYVSSTLFEIHSRFRPTENIGQDISLYGVIYGSDPSVILRTAIENSRIKMQEIHANSTLANSTMSDL